MPEKTVITVLGCGNSGGVPSYGYGFGLCDPDNPKNKRSRPSVFIEQGERRLLIDTAPELRLQLIENNIPPFKDILYTHEHYDHISGIGDLRDVIDRVGGKINIYGMERTLNQLRREFPFAFKSRSGAEKLNPRVLRPGEVFSAGGFEIISTELDHGSDVTSLGYRFKNFAYTTDIKRLNNKNKEILKDLDVWIVSCLSEAESDYHAQLKDVLEWIKELKPGRVYLTHMRADLDYEATRKKLPENIRPCYDGLRIEV